jgi:hypothetical protein
MNARQIALFIRSLQRLTLECGFLDSQEGKVETES